MDFADELYALTPFPQMNWTQRLETRGPQRAVVRCRIFYVLLEPTGMKNAESQRILSSESFPYRSYETAGGHIDLLDGKFMMT